MTDNELNKIFLNTLKAPCYDRMIENSNTNFSNVVSMRKMIENGVKLYKIESIEAKKSTPKKKEEEMHAVSYQGKTYNPFYSRQPDRDYQSYNQYAGAAHKGITSPTLGQWLISLLCLHQLMEGLLNRQVSHVITAKIIEGQDLNKIGPSLTLFQ